MADFFEKFRDVKGEEPKKIEEQLENKLIFTRDDFDAQKVLQKLLKGEEFEIEFQTRYFQEYQDIYKKGDEKLKRLGFSPQAGSVCPGEPCKIIYRFTNNYPEYLIVKHAEDNQLMDGILKSLEIDSRFLPKEDAYVFMALLKNQKEPITAKQTQYFEKIASNLENNDEYFLIQNLIDDLNNFAKEKNLNIPKLEHRNKKVMDHNVCHFEYSKLEQDAQERARILLPLIENDKLLANTCERCGIANPDSFLAHTWFSLLDGAANHHETWYGRERGAIVKYLVLDKLSEKFGMPRDYVDSQFKHDKTKYFGSGGIELAAIINRAYRIESGRKPLEL